MVTRSLEPTSVPSGPGGLALAWTLARRELRGSTRGFIVFLACLALGVAAIAAVGVINAGVLEGLARDARTLLGGEIRIENPNVPVDDETIAGVFPEGTRISRVVRTNGMAYGAEGRNVVVSLKAADDAYPLFGNLELDPPLSPDEALANRGIVVERSLLPRLDVEVGERIRIGSEAFTLRAVIEREPDRIGGFISIGPRALIGLSDLEGTGIIQPGALATYAYYADLPPGVAPATELARIRADHGDATWRARGLADAESSVARFTDRLASYLTIAGLTALLTGGLGVALAIQNYLAARVRTIATLKCLGAPSGLIFRVYFLQVLALAGIGIVLGVALGQLAPLLVRLLPADLIPVPVVEGIYPVPLLIAAGCGLSTAVAFAIWPLALARDTTPASMFRSLVEPSRRWPRGRYLAALGLAVVSFAALAINGVAEPWLGAIFVGSAFAAALILTGFARLLLAGARRLRGRGGTALRMALGNLVRPGAGVAGVIAALGAGLTVLCMVALLQANLGAELRERLPGRAPAFFFIDIQPDQFERFEELVAEVPSAEILGSTPMVRARVVEIDRRAVDQVEVGEEVDWTTRRDRGLTWSTTVPGGSEVVRGDWWPADYAGPPLVSIDSRMREGYGVDIGDTLSFNVLGRVIEAEIASFRAMDWESAQLNFLFVLSPGVLESAPHTMVATVEAPEADEPVLLDAIADDLPNVTPISVRAIVGQFESALGKIGLAVSAVGGLTLLAGVLVLAGAIAAARRRHLYESVVLKVLGARRSQLLRVFLLEYLSMGAAAAVAGLVLGTIGAFAVVIWVMDLPWTFSLGAVLPVVLGTLAATAVAGFLGTWQLLGRPAAGVLRSP